MHKIVEFYSILIQKAKQSRAIRNKIEICKAGKPKKKVLYNPNLQLHGTQKHKTHPTNDKTELLTKHFETHKQIKSINKLTYHLLA